MLNLKQPLTLVTCASDCLIELVLFWNSHQLDIQSFTILREYLLSIPNNLFDQWAEKLMLRLGRLQRNSDALFLIFSSALTRMDIDHFPTLPVNVNRLCDGFRFTTNLRYLCCRYAPFFWSPSDLLMLQKSVGHFTNLQRLVICNIDLMESPSFLETVGNQLSSLKELDISYGKIPADSYKKIGDNFLHLEVLRIKQHSEEFRTITRKHAIQLLVCLLKLKILDDDSTAWSCVLPALTQLSKEMYSHLCASIEHLTIYQCSEVNIKFTKKVVSVCLDTKVFRESPEHNVTSVSTWLCNNFPGLLSINLRLENVLFTTIANFLQSKSMGWKIHSIFLSKIPLNVTHFQIIGKYAPNLKKLEILNQVILDVSTNNQHIAADDVGRLARPYFRHLTHLSFTGAWTENIVCVLLNNCVFLQDLILKPNVLPVTFLKHNPLSYLQRLILDRSHLVWNECDLELNFLRYVLKSASNSLRELGLKSRPPIEWDSLLQQLKLENCDFQILRPIV
ncbi:uncharacterized protein LOC130697511 isoform X1 [Daphnia carinata]|uniref:uncharacterized protein LOC130697511 isoform X1 n=2 Tax=Daphnia carinata TaxID=120202 RepID=UPI00257C3500|nr:uncharacterized protein LOC130697511 isoform X1 [Daphnia carinata]